MRRSAPHSHLLASARIRSARQHRRATFHRLPSLLHLLPSLRAIFGRYEDTLLLVDPSIGGLPYIDWRNMDLAAYDKYFGILRMTPLAEFSAEAKAWGPKSTDGLYVLGPNAGPLADWPIALSQWTDWFPRQPQEVRDFFSEVDEYYYDEELMREATGWEGISGETLLLGGTIDSSEGPPPRASRHGPSHRVHACGAWRVKCAALSAPEGVGATIMGRGWRCRQQEQSAPLPLSPPRVCRPARVQGHRASDSCACRQVVQRFRLEILCPGLFGHGP